jgi:hypothetical protein
VIADRLEAGNERPRGDHYKVRAPGIETVLTIPARRPIKPVYVRALAALVDRLQAGRNC